MTEGANKPTGVDFIESIDQLRRERNYNTSSTGSSVYVVTASVLEEINQLLRFVDLLGYTFRELQEQANRT